jgi:hypothetical protein
MINFSKKITKNILIYISCLFSIINIANAQELPKWFVKPKNNNIELIYGIGEGATIEEATKNGLAEASARLMVSISAESQLIKEENQNSYNEELRQKVKQSIEKISFTGYKISQSAEVKNRFYVEVTIERDPFINQQKERIEFIQKKISDLDKNSQNTNPIQRRNNLLKIVDLGNELEIKARILSGAEEEIDLKSIIELLSKYQNELEKTSDKIEFVIDSNSKKNIASILNKAINKEKLKIVKSQNPQDKNLVLIKIDYDATTNFIYGSYNAKLEINIENFNQSKLLASNNIEVSGSSTISNEEAIKSALKSFEDMIVEKGILKILAIIN